MNRLSLLLLSLLGSVYAFAQLNGDGYYRVKNVEQGRYIGIIDDKTNNENIAETTTPDLGALRTVFGFERVVSDPSTILYMRKVGDGWDLRSQGASSYAIVGRALLIQETSKGYLAYAEDRGIRLYVADSPLSVWSEGDDLIYGKVVTADSKDGSANTRLWNILPVNSTGNNYLGITPDIEVDGAYYKSFYAAFPFTFYSSGPMAYYISMVDEKKSAAVYQEVSGGVPEGMPVFIKCTSNDPSMNRINVGAGVATTKPKDNQMTGVYFCNPAAETDLHRNVVKFNPSTMRVLGKSADGRLAFIKPAGLQYIPANTTYITVSPNAPSELYVMSEEEYKAIPEGIKGDVNGDGEVNVGDLVSVSNFMAGDTTVSKEKADVNGDGEVNIGDLVTISNIMAGNE